MFKRPLFPSILLASALSAGAATAQVTPSDVRDLAGARAAGAESELASRGYVTAGGRTGDDRKWTYWWNATRGVCLSVATMNGRYDSIVSTPAADCRQGGGGVSYQPDPPFRPDGGGYREHIALICYGEGEKLSNEYRSGYEWDRDKRRYVPRSGYELTRKDYETSVSIQIDGGVGRIRPAKSMLPPMHGASDGGWYDIDGLSVSRDTISGRFKLNGLNRPKMTINRQSGRITLEGLTEFRGTCDAMDADRKF
ncbi:MAG: hypothetical protein KKE02_16235 [Alphaproteobacteria bacterium]|nr:hypothetical protein [Alphaproteobacteria bacterium]MBU1515359.1 hypothetical protein [Alphaproteobacteria bacterium]MBU2095409.1 hypothetical protein [Alphaproteobacteria bacterium]MBU2152571.1 hypothetical protein [Alphaproteobacteria bacterium]MBU2309967.1 hypothetical protein [Alphaproteobacteria bacterium]